VVRVVQVVQVDAADRGLVDHRDQRILPRLRAVTEQVRALLNGDRVTLSAVPAARALRLGQPPVPDLPIWLAATGERTIRVAADLADGWYPLYLRPGRVRELGAGLAGPRAATHPLTVAAGPFTVVDPDVAAARATAAECTAAYLGVMGDIYPEVLARQGLATEVGLVRATRTIPAEAQILLDEFTAYGTAATVREQLERWDAVTDITMVGLPPGLSWPRLEATIRACAPRLAAAR
ncbi:LLM class flavin-dependent oxidoreductase, partial [Actinoplanes sp. NPDC048791]|uniref:LLM class flavin-dependent oxidoreductase n=1 Tax=Actinoplanes sp. NPDC048791 TaxID=3154623 RepID=UPI0033E67EC7